MRIISQDGMIDVPYEQVIVNIDYRNTCRIIAGGVDSIESPPLPMAIYFTEKKAIKAMEMLHKAYTGSPIEVQDVDISEDISEILKEWGKQGICVQTANNELSKVECINNSIFRFPKDEEVKA